MKEAPVPPPERLVTPKRAEEDAAELALRPQTLDDFVGQKQVRENLKIFISAAKSRGEALDHVLFHGPPGLGKTTLAQIVAREMGVGFRATSGPVIQKAGDLAAQLTNLQPHDVLFIDEIHRLAPSIEEMLYPAMEDFQLDLMIGEGPAARSVRIELPPFTLVGATTRSGLMTRPLRERFGIPLRLVFYEPAELETIVHRAARVLKMQMAKDGGAEIARRSRGTPRVANRLLRRVRDFAAVGGQAVVDARRRRCGADAARDRRTGPRRHGSPLPGLHRRELRRRAGRRRDLGGRSLRAARRHRGRDRALPDAARPADAHAARPDAVRRRLPPSRRDDAQGSEATARPAGDRRPGGGGVSAPISGGPTSGHFSDGVHVLPLRIYYEDTDAAGIVYYANWLRFLERGRTELLRLLGQEHSALSDERGVHWVVRRCTIDYLKPARLDETIEVTTRCGELRGASLDMIQQARRGEEILVRAEILVACMGAGGRPVRLPQHLRTALAQVSSAGSPRSRHIQV